MRRLKITLLTVLLLAAGSALGLACADGEWPADATTDGRVSPRAADGQAAAPRAATAWKAASGQLQEGLSAPAPRPLLPVRRRTSARDERPLSGHPGLAARLEGNARGTGLHDLLAESRGLAERSQPDLSAVERAAVALDRPAPPFLEAPVRRPRAVARLERSTPASPPSSPLPSSHDILTWTRRQNE